MGVRVRRTPVCRRPLLTAAVVIALLAVGPEAMPASAPRRPGPMVGQARREIALIVSGGTILTQNAAHAVLAPGAIAIDGTDILTVDRPDVIASRFTARETIHAPDQVVLPRPLNPHTHAPMVLYRGLADDLALMDWLKRYIFPAEAKTVSPEMVRIGTRLAALEMIESGTTTYADMYYFEEEIAKATREAGLRGVL